MKVIFAKKCVCGAITVTYENDEFQEVTTSMPENIFQQNFFDAELGDDEYGCCDYCVNKWGVDLCGCGSGEKVGECQNDFAGCREKIPAQELNVPRQWIGWGN